MPERCNRPAWRYHVNGGYRVCRDHASVNDPDERLAENMVGPCDYPLDGLGAMSWPRRLAVYAERGYVTS